MWKSSMCESDKVYVVYMMDFTASLNINELYYCNLLHDESIQKTNNKKYMYRCIGGMYLVELVVYLNGII